MIMFKREVCAFLYLLPSLTIVESGYSVTEDNQATPRLRGNVKGELPTLFDRLSSDVTQPFKKDKETPVLWKISKTGSSTSVQPYLSDCLSLVVANEIGASLDEINNESLQIVELASERRYINLDTGSLQGLSDTKAQHLVESGLADVIISPLLNQVLELFNPERKAKLFTFLRHPVERAVSLFYHRQQDEAKRGDTTKLQAMTLEEYANSDLVESNLIVRMLTNKASGLIKPEDLQMAKSILQQKFVVGLSSKMDESLDRIQKYFGWEAVDHYRLGVFQRIKDCKAQYLSSNHVAKYAVPHSPIEVGSSEWDILSIKNWADIALYEFALDVYRDQETTLFTSTSERISSNEGSSRPSVNYASIALEAHLNMQQMDIAFSGNDRGQMLL